MGPSGEPAGIQAESPQFESRDTHARFIAYVPLGSVKKGETLAASGGGKTVACAGCHGRALGGAGEIPGIAGRSPTENLALEDMIALAAYAASRAPALREE